MERMGSVRRGVGSHRRHHGNPTVGGVARACAGEAVTMARPGLAVAGVGVAWRLEKEKVSPMKAGKRHSAVAGVVVAALVCLAACSSDNRKTTASPSFAPSATAPAISCASGTLTAGGSSAQYNAMLAWIKAYQHACPGATVSYRSTSSSTGRQSFIDKEIDFAGSDSALAPPQTMQASATCVNGGDAIDLPMVLGPITLVYNLPGVTSLKLTPSLVAQIFSGKITNWNNPVIAAVNQGVTLPSATIQTVHRSDGSGTTDNFTKFLAGAAPSAWSYDHSSNWPAPGGQGSKGSSVVASTVKATPYAIGYVELSYATQSGLPTALIENAAGQYVVPSAHGASLGLSTATLASEPDLVVTFNYTTPVANAYPIYLVSYEIMCSTGAVNPAAEAPLKSFLTYTSSSAAQSSLTSFGYAPLPTALNAKVAAEIASLP
jgi:phosphate transport system substrate-binding protein